MITPLDYECWLSSVTWTVCLTLGTDTSTDWLGGVCFPVCVVTWRTDNSWEKSYKSAGVVVPQSLGVAKGLEQWVGLQDDVFDVLRGDRWDELLVDITHTPACTHTHAHTEQLAPLWILPHSEAGVVNDVFMHMFCFFSGEAPKQVLKQCELSSLPVEQLLPESEGKFSSFTSSIYLKLVTFTLSYKQFLSFCSGAIKAQG